jgi:glyoxylase-like metal-dependent hydrolase (beta-lactamase superfamily II)
MKRIFFGLGVVPLVLTLAACAPAVEPEAEAPASVEPEGPARSIVNITGDLYRAQNNNHHTVFLVTEEGIIMSDPINRDFATYLKAELEDRFTQPVRYVLYSHSDWDHASGGEVFADTAEFIGHENMLDALAAPADMALPANAAELDANGNGEIELSEATGNFQNNFANFDANADGMLSGGEIARGPVSDVHPPTDTYSDRRTVTLGGRSVEMIHPGPAHSANMSVLHFPEESAIFVVDFISLGRLPFQTMAGYDHELWTGEFRDVEALGAEFVIPAHGVVGSTADLAEYRQYHQDLYDAVAEGMAAGSSLEELQASITMDAYSDWANYEQWVSLNVEGMYNSMNP